MCARQALLEGADLGLATQNDRNRVLCAFSVRRAHVSAFFLFEFSFIFQVVHCDTHTLLVTRLCFGVRGLGQNKVNCLCSILLVSFSPGR